MKKEILVSVDRGETRVATLEGKGAPTRGKGRQKKAAPGDEWKVSELGRRAKYYRLTPAGRRQLAIETSEWERMSAAIGRVIKLA